MQKNHDVMRGILGSGFKPLRRFGLLAVLAASWFVPWAAQAQSPVRIKIAAASNLKFVLADLASQYRHQTGVQVDVNLGASGNLARQILQGLPVEQFISADEERVTELVKAGRTLAFRPLRAMLAPLGAAGGPALDDFVQTDFGKMDATAALHAGFVELTSKQSFAGGREVYKLVDGMRNHATARAMAHPTIQVADVEAAVAELMEMHP
jgi:hypothetical protein